jgi:hypothetical protein
MGQLHARRLSKPALLLDHYNTKNPMRNPYDAILVNIFYNKKR